jgi:nicotinamidase-related amidase
MSLPRLDPATTGLVVVDLQRGITQGSYAPHTAAGVVERSAALARAFRAAGATVALVHVQYAGDEADAPHREVDQPRAARELPPDFSEIVPELERAPGDVVVTKRNWGAFHDTGLDLQMRRRGIATLVLTGIATNMGVESTARDAYERDYRLVFAEDAITSFSAEHHEFAMRNIFPRIGRVRSTSEILDALATAPSASASAEPAATPRTTTT